MTTAIVGLRYALSIESVRSDNIRTCLEIAAVNVEDDIRACQSKHIIIAFHLSSHVAQERATKVFLVQPEGLNHRAHGSIQKQDTSLYCITEHHLLPIEVTYRSLFRLQIYIKKAIYKPF